MIVHEVYINSFGRLNGCMHVFDDGLNVLSGENGSGKTTLAMFICAMFYGMPKTRFKDLDKNPLYKYKPWFTPLTGGSVTFSHEGNRYRIERGAGLERVKVVNLALNKECDFGSCPGEAIFGIDRAAFMRSAYVRQTAWVTVNEEDGSDSLNKKLTEFTKNDGDAGCEEALDLLDKKREQISKRSGKGELDEYRNKLKEVEKRISEAEDEYDRLRSESDHLLLIKEQIKSLKQQDKDAEFFNKICAAKRILRDAEEIKKIDEETNDAEIRLTALKEGRTAFADAENKISLIKKAIELDTDERMREEEFNRLKGNFDIMRDELLKCDAEKKRLETERREALSKIVGPPQNVSTDIKNRHRFGKPAIFFGLLFIASFALLLIEASLFLPAAGACLLFCALFTGLWARAYKKNVSVDDGYGEATGLITELNSEIEAKIKTIDDGIMEADMKAGGILNYVGAESISDALISLTEKDGRAKGALERLKEAKRARADFHEAQRAVISAFETFVVETLKIPRTKFIDAEGIAVIEKLFREKTIENNQAYDGLQQYIVDLSAKKARLSGDPHAITEATALRESMPGFFEDTLGAFSASSLENLSEICLSGNGIDEKAIADRLHEAEKKESATEAGLKEKTSRLPILADLYNRREHFREKVNLFELQLYAVEKTKECLKVARDRLSSAFVPKINAEFNALISEISGGRIHSCEINNSLGISVTDGGFSRDLSYYSSGTRELIEFVMRLSVIKAMYGKIPFLMLDDCFTNLDDETFKRVKSLLRTLSMDTQVIYFTCRKEFENPVDR